MLKTQGDYVFTNTDPWIDIHFNNDKVVEFAYNFIKDKFNIKNETDELKNKTFQTEHYIYVINWLRKNKIIQLCDHFYRDKIIYVPIRDGMKKPEILCEIIKQNNVNKECYFFNNKEIMIYFI
jgi:hypothetical protein